jgi:hypothetical protein
MKTSDICILISVAVAFVTTAFLWFQGVDTKQEALIFFTGFFCFALAIVGAVMTVVEFKRIEKEDKK